MSGRQRQPTVAVVAAVAVIAAVGWVAVSHLVGGQSSAAQRTSVAVPVVTSVRVELTPRRNGRSVTAGPDGDSSGVPTGYVDTTAGARAAAVGWVSSLGTLIRLGPIATTDALRAVTSARVAEATIDRFRTERDEFTDSVPRRPVAGDLDRVAVDGDGDGLVERGRHRAGLVAAGDRRRRRSRPCRSCGGPTPCGWCGRPTTGRSTTSPRPRARRRRRCPRTCRHRAPSSRP